jgi:hypothetical protein
MSNLPAQFNLILDQFTPDILGAFWITDGELSRELPCFAEFNYLFDGLVSQYLFGNEKSVLPRANIFFTQNFAQKIFLSHIKNEGDLSSHLDEQISIVKSTNDERNKILVLNQASRDWSLELQKRYPQFEFTKLDY